MSPIAIVFVFATLGAFGAGVVFHKFVVSESEKVKAHVTSEVAALRLHISSTLSGFAKRI